MDDEFVAYSKSSFSLCVLIPGQIVIVGSGISETSIFLSEKLIVTGLSCHADQTREIEEPQHKSDTTNATIHHNLIQKILNLNDKT